MSGDESQEQVSKPREIVSLEEIKVLSHPIRADVMRRLSIASEPLSVRELAAAMGFDAPKLHYHAALLEEHGFIEVAETRLSGKRLERRYRVSADHFHLGEGVLPAALKEVASRFVSSLRDAARGFVDLPGDPEAAPAPPAASPAAEPSAGRPDASQSASEPAVDLGKHHQPSDARRLGSQIASEFSVYVGFDGVEELSSRLRDLWQRFVRDHPPRAGEPLWRVDLVFGAAEASEADGEADARTDTKDPA